jgi:hypothetical protein
LQADADDKQRDRNRQVQRLPTRKALESEEKRQDVGCADKVLNADVVDAVRQVAHTVVVVRQQRVKDGRRREAEHRADEEVEPGEALADAPRRTDQLGQSLAQRRARQAQKIGGWPQVRVHARGLVVAAAHAGEQTVPDRRAGQTIARFDERHRHASHARVVAIDNDKHR